MLIQALYTINQWTSPSNNQ